MDRVGEEDSYTHSHSHAHVYTQREERESVSHIYLCDCKVMEEAGIVKRWRCHDVWIVIFVSKCSLSLSCMCVLNPGLGLFPWSDDGKGLLMSAMGEEMV